MECCPRIGRPLKGREKLSKKKNKRSSGESAAKNEIKNAAVTLEKQESEPKENKPARTVKNIRPNDKTSKTPIFLILAFIVPFLVMGVVFARAKIYPFGDRQVLYSDCKQQYLPFLKEFQRKLKSGDSLFYTWHSGMGTNFLAMIGYYIASPLNFLSLFVPVKYIREALAVFIMIKVGCASLFTAVFLRHVYRRNDISLVAFGCCYAFCDYLMGYYWNTIWLDSVALLPLVALGVYCVVNEKRFRLYIIALALSFLASYYIGYMVCVFVILWFIVQTFIKGFDLVEFCENILKMTLYSVIALLLTMPVTLVSLIQLRYTVGADDSFPDKLEIYNNFMEMISNLLSFHETTTMEGLPNVGTGVICILMLVIFIRSKDISRGEKISLLSLLGLLFLSLNINALDYIWHGFHYPNLIPYRFAFLFSFVFVVIAYRAFTVFVQIDKKDLIGMCVLTICMVCVSVFYLDRKAIIGSLIVAAVYIIFMTLYELDLLDRRLLTLFTSLIVIAEMCFECSVGVNTVGTTKHDDYPASEAQVTSLTDYAARQDDGLYRIDQTYYSTKNDGMIYGYNSAGQFSSTSYKTLIDFTADFGLVSKRSSFQYLLTSPVVSMLLSEKYIIARDGFTADESTLTEVKRSDDAVMYENSYWLPMGYMADSAVRDTELDGQSVFETQNKVFSALTGIDENVYNILEPYSFDCENVEQSRAARGLYSYKLYSDAHEGTIKVSYMAPEEGMLYAWANVKSNDYIDIRGANISHSYNIESQRYVFPLGYYKKNEVVILTVDAEKSGTNKIIVSQLNQDVLDRGYAALSDEPLELTKHGSTTLEGTISAKNDGTFMTSIPYEKGWTLYVDGVKTETVPVLDGAFLTADITKGDHDIRLEYTPQGFVPGLIAAAAALALFIFLCIYTNKKRC